MRTLKQLLRRAAVLVTSTALVVGAGTSPAMAAPPHPVSITDVTVAEGNAGTTMATFTISYTGPNNASTVDWATSNQTASAGSDYTASSGTASLPSGGCKCTTVSVPVLGDLVDEPNETFAVNLTNPSSGTIADAQGVGTITDDDGTPTISVLDESAAEDAGPLTFDVTLSNPAASTVTVNFATSDGSATAGADYTAATGTVTFLAGDTSEPVNVTLSDDELAEADETLNLTLSNPSNATISDGTAVGTITDDDTPPVIAVDDIAMPEGDAGQSTGVFTISLSKAHVSPVTVDFATADDSAVDGDDYAGTSGTVSFAAGDTTETVDVDVYGDLLAENEETFDVILSNATGGIAIADDTGVATINDDDPDPALSVDDEVVAEGGSAEFTVSLDAPAGRTVTVEYATTDATGLDGEDYTGVAGTLTFVPGDTDEAVVVDTLDDSVFEADETFSVMLSDPVDATIVDDTGTGSISDDDAAPVFSVDDVSVDEGESVASFTVTKTGDTALDASVDVATVDGSATASEDYDALTSTLTFGPADGSVQVDVTLTDDAVFEGAEAFDLLLSNPVDATLGDDTATASIGDDEVAPSLSIDDVTVDEGDDGDSAADFTVTLTGGTTVDASVDYTIAGGSAVVGDDVAGDSGTLTIPAGETTGTISVAVIGDAVYEDDEAYTVELANASNATIDDGEGSGGITNDDAMPSIAVDDVTVTEGNSGTTAATFTVTRTGATALPVGFEVATSDGSATAGVDYTSLTGTRNISAVQTTRTVTVDVVGDAVDELDESFFLEISAPTNATISDGDGLATITDDDKAVAALTVKAKKTPAKVQASGVLEPATSTSKVLVILQRKVGSGWKAVAKKRVTVTQVDDRDADTRMDALYRATFKRPVAGRYRFVVKSPATLDTSAATGSRGLRV